MATQPFVPGQLQRCDCLATFVQFRSIVREVTQKTLVYEVYTTVLNGRILLRGTKIHVAHFDPRSRNDELDHKS